MLSIRQNQCKTIKSFIVSISLSNTYMERMISQFKPVTLVTICINDYASKRFFYEKFISENVGMILSRRNFFGHLNSC